jgi:hypothetical protein
MKSRLAYLSKIFCILTVVDMAQIDFSEQKKIFAEKIY